jgi:hypothetical protein
MIERRKIADERTLKSHIGAMSARPGVEARPAFVYVVFRVAQRL